MSNEPSPRPWQVRYGDTVADATGAKVAACLRPENAALIVDAVNERERMRDIVRSARSLLLRVARTKRESWEYAKNNGIKELVFDIASALGEEIKEDGEE